MKKTLLLLSLLAAAMGAYAQNLTVHCNDKGKYGYVDENGKEVVKCQYDLTEKFENGFGKVQKGDKYGFVNSKGKLVVMPKKESYEASGGYLWKLNKKKGKLEVLDDQGKKIVNMSDVAEMIPAKDGQRQFWIVLKSVNKQMICDLETGDQSPLYDDIELLSLEKGKELYAVKKSIEWRMMDGTFSNPLPSNGYCYKAVDIYSLYTLWEINSDTGLIIDYLEYKSKEDPKSVDLQSAFKEEIKFIKDFGVTVNFNHKIPTFVWSINNLVK